MTEVDTLLEDGSDGKLFSGSIQGSDEARISGLMAVFNLDSRDNIYSPNYGSFIESSARFSSTNFGASYGFNKFFIDMRTYLSITKKSLLALQLYNENSYGDVPFQDMAWFGGGERGRGYFNGRFIDNQMYVLQGEVRRKITERFRIAGFILFGEVAEVTSDYFSDVKRSFGGGIRWQFTKKNPSLIRLDIGIGEDGQSGFYFGVNEAF
jgi:outer membrane protein assembly factor BamA